MQRLLSCLCLVAGLLVAVSVFVGCASTTTTVTADDTPPAADDLAVSPTQLDIDAREYRRLFDAALLVLRDAGFTLDRRDYRLGIITTRPLFAPTIFEPWHSRHASAATTFESTFNDQRRLVRVSLPPAQPADDNTTEPAMADTYQLIVEVQIERRQHGLQRLEGSTDAGQLVGSMRRTEQADTDSDHWRPMGRDVALEERLLQQIVRRSFEPVAAR